MKSLRGLILKNASANVVRGLATAVVALTLPHFLTRSLDPGRFDAWSLILQISSYAGFLDFGLQTAVARFFAGEMENGTEEKRNALVSTSFAMLSAAALFALLAVALLIQNTTHLFPGIPAALLGEFQRSALALAVSSCLLLPFSTWTGVLLGLHRNEFPALSIGLSRLAGALAVVLAVRHTHSLLVLSCLLGASNLLGGLSQFVAVRRLAPTLRLAFRSVERGIAAELARYCAGLSLWAFGMLIISGLDVTLVGHFDFAAVGVYSVAATLSLFFAGLNQSVISALMTPIAALQARGGQREIAALVLRITRFNALGNFILALLCLAFGHALLRLWVGPAYAEAAYPLLAVLVVAQSIRLAGNPYSVTLVAIDRQTQALAPAVVEALLNFALSLLGVILVGPIGVAGGTLIGACAGLATLLLRTAPRLRSTLGFGASELFREGLLRPLFCVLPLAVSVALTLLLGRWTLPLSLAGLILTAAAISFTERKSSLPHPGNGVLLRSHSSPL